MCQSVRVAAAAAPPGVVTFLFTDVEGSTRRWEADADGMRNALAAHDKTLRAAIEANDGFQFKQTGDGVVAAFASPRSAVEAAEAANNPWVLANALYSYGYALGDADPVGALEALRRGLAIARDSGSRLTESLLATALARLEVEHGDSPALEHITLAIRNFYDSGNVAYIRFALATLAVLLDRLGRHAPAATIAGFAAGALAASALPQLGVAITHLRDVLGEQTYAALAGRGEAMNIAAIVAYAHDQIDQARAELSAVSK